MKLPFLITPKDIKYLRNWLKKMCNNSTLETTNIVKRY